MIGRKSNLKFLTSKLWEVGVTIVKTTEFVQGQTCRWGLAWSFLPPIKKKISPQVVEKSVLSFTIEVCISFLSLLCFQWALHVPFLFVSNWHVLWRWDLVTQSTHTKTYLMFYQAWYLVSSNVLTHTEIFTPAGSSASIQCHSCVAICGILFLY